MAKGWTSIASLAKKTGKSVDEMTDLLKGAGKTFSKSGKSVQGSVNLDKLLLQPAHKPIDLTENAIKNARKTKVVNNSLEDLTLKRGARFEKNQKLAEQIQNQRAMKEFVDSEIMDIKMLGTNTDAVARGAEARAKREQLIANKRAAANLNQGNISKDVDSRLNDKILEYRNYYNQKGINKELTKTDISAIRDEIYQNEFTAFKGPEFEKKYKEVNDTINRRQRQADTKQRILNERQQRVGNSSATNTDRKGLGNNWVYKAAGAGVTGGLVLSMARDRGQQNNNQLYGQY